MLALLRFAHIIARAMGNKLFYMTSYFHVEKVPTARGRQVRKHMSACQWSIGEKKWMLICNKMPASKREMGNSRYTEEKWETRDTLRKFPLDKRN